MPIDYKDTLNLPQTRFPMKANLSQKEPELLEFWKSEAVYFRMQDKNRKNPSYILHDGPPYANGNIHIGHALNKILKDIIVKYKSMRGFYAPYVPGWDCHGLPIELQVDKKLGEKKDQIDNIQKRQLCREYAEKFVAVQRDEFERLGIFGDWMDPYLTMAFSYEASIVREFFSFVKKGSVYKGKKPVHWCPSCVTALAEAEVEYADKESPSVFVKFRVPDEQASKYLPTLADRKISVLIWTTTPWTLPANLALAMNPELEYAVVEHDGEALIVASGNLEALKEKIQLAGNVLLKVTGDKLEGMAARHPFIDRESRIILGDFVAVGEGSGIVHIAPGHGEDDYTVGLKYGLDIYAPVDDRGKFTKAVPELEGQFVFKANEVIIGILKEKNALVGREDIRHSYPHCWRCKRPVIFRATAQWFISMDANNLREKCIEEINRVQWVPSWGRERILGMVSGRPDWCISRQRSWGVPIMLITCEDCGAFINDNELFDRITGLVEEKGADIWYSMGVQDLLGAECRCPSCGSSSIKKEMDILDVWFDSGVSHAAVMEQDKRLTWPADLYLEGSDQHRGWFQSSLLASTGTRDKAPYNTVLTHGFTVDGQGKKMSKSLGNVISPQEVIKANGAEIIRLWVSAEDYSDDVRLSKEIISRLTEAYRKIRNTGRYLLGNISDFDGMDYSSSLTELDKWAMSRLQRLIKKVTCAYERFDFHEVFHSLYNFCIVDMSSFYLDILKDRLYTYRKDSTERRAAQWVLRQILVDMTRLMAPVLSFTAEEIWKYIPDRGESESSVFLAGFPEYRQQYHDEELEARWQTLITIRDEANKALEIQRKDKFIGNALEAKLVFHLEDEQYGLLDRYSELLPALFIVSEVELRRAGDPAPDVFKSEEVKGMSIEVLRASGAKCDRCWNRSTSVGASAEHPAICERCFKAIA
ncbi:MAG: isoleucine--tRNA ligase [Dissulfurispiraceae bacterium]|jgi:isoleucyl-tRNA synthetase|nr:isoleucine--tRNA ligase [Dissulfurispiraceae bacterium]